MGLSAFFFFSLSQLLMKHSSRGGKGLSAVESTSLLWLGMGTICMVILAVCRFTLLSVAPNATLLAGSLAGSQRFVHTKH